MHFVVLGVHSAEVCPTSNAKSRALLMEMGPQIPKLAEQHGVKLVAGPYVNREHMTVTVAETDSAEALDAFLVASRLHQWNQLRIIPSHTMEQGMKESMTLRKEGEPWPSFKSLRRQRLGSVKLSHSWTTG
jgi:hypothetical protein